MRTLFSNVTQFDTLLCMRIFSLNGRRILDYFMFSLSRMGDGYAYAAIGIILLFFFPDIRFQILPAALVAFAVEIPVFKILKEKTKRDRPFVKIPGINFLIKPPDKFSFPSGHTAAAFLMATILGAFFPMLAVLFYALAALIGFSRIYNGLHFPTDVLAGVILGVTSAKIGLLIIL